MKKSTDTLSIERRFSGIEDIWIYNLYQYFENQDMNWFLKGYDGRQKKLSEKELYPIMFEITEEWYKKSNNRSLEGMVGKLAKINFLKSKYLNVCNLLNIFYNGFGEDLEMRHRYIMEIKNYGFKMPMFNSESGDREEVLRVRKEVEGIKTQIAIIISEIKTEGTKKKRSLNQELAMIGNALGFTFMLDAKKITALQYLDYVEMLEEKAKNN